MTSKIIPPLSLLGVQLQLNYKMQTSRVVFSSLQEELEDARLRSPSGELRWETQKVEKVFVAKPRWREMPAEVLSSRMGSNGKSPCPRMAEELPCSGGSVISGCSSRSAFLTTAHLHALIKPKECSK